VTTRALSSDEPRRRAVITGIGVVAPNGQDVDTFWRSIRDGQSAADWITQFDTADCPHKIGAEIRDFDCSWLLDAKKIRRYDKSIKYAIVAAAKAITDSGVDMKTLDPDRRGVVEGTTVSGMESVFKAHTTYVQGHPEDINPINIINGFAGEGSSAIALELGLHGHVITMCSGCCSSNDAIGYALRMIQEDEADVMIAGGADANVLGPLWASYASLGVMTKRKENPKGAMRPFDRYRDGFVLADGAAFLVVEELSHAVARGARIYAELLAHGRSCEAHHVVDLHPDGVGIVRAIEKAMKKTRLEREAVQYINVHGTATKTNDPIETKAIKKFFGAHAYRLAVSATKPITGHMMGSVAAVETAICALSLFHEVIPATINFTEPAEGCDLDYVPNVSRPYPLKIALNLNSGFGGKNTCLVLGRYTPDEE
jgi:3-oxoacyl-[acyl-carrier-protein] synthase II